MRGVALLFVALPLALLASRRGGVSLGLAAGALFGTAALGTLLVAGKLTWWAKVVLALGLLVTAASLALAAEPAASPGTGGDPRSPGQGPGLVGDPLFAIGAVLLVAVTSVALTVAYVRLTDARSDRRRS